jgi:DNA-binding MarR family transcriptional regulator
MVTKRSPLHLPLPPEDLGLEASVTQDDHQSLRLWLRMMSCTNQVHSEIRRRLRAQFGMSIARFDYLAQLHRYPDGLTMSALSSHLMVTGGNVTGLTHELEKDGWVERETDPNDRRSTRVQLTQAGFDTFERIASVHEAWVVSMFSGLRVTDRQQLTQLLGQLRLLVAHSDDTAEAPAPAPATSRQKRPKP